MSTPGDVLHAQAAPARWRCLSCLGCLLREARPVVQVIFLCRFSVGCAVGIAAGGVLGSSTVVMAVAWLAVVLGIYLCNGVSDLPGDVANGSGRPLATGRLRPQVALRAALTCTVVGVAGAAVTRSAALLVITVLMVGAGWLYSYGPRPFKNGSLPAALSFVGGGLLTYLAGAVSTGALPSADALGIIALLSIWMGVGGSAKDLGDVAGDALAGRRTLPIVLGPRRAARLIAAGCLVLALCGATSVGGGSRHWLAALVLSVGALVVAIGLTCQGASAGQARGRSAYRAFMVVQYSANVTLLASCAWAPAA